MTEKLGARCALVAIDCGKRAGAAVFGCAGLIKAQLLEDPHGLFLQKDYDRSLCALLPSGLRLTHVALEGNYGRREWRHAALTHGADVDVISVPPMAWRELVLLPEERTSGLVAKHASRWVARQMMSDGGLFTQQPLDHNIAESVLIGAYVAHGLGWFGDRLPLVRRDGRGLVDLPLNAHERVRLAAQDGEEALIHLLRTAARGGSEAVHWEAVGALRSQSHLSKSACDALTLTDVAMLLRAERLDAAADAARVLRMVSAHREHRSAVAHAVHDQRAAEWLGRRLHAAWGEADERGCAHALAAMQDLAHILALRGAWAV